MTEGQIMRHNLFGIPVGLGVLFDALWTGGDVLLMLGTELYTPLAVSASWIAPEVSWLDEEIVTLLAVLAASLYVTNVLLNIYERRKERGLTDEE